MSPAAGVGVHLEKKQKTEGSGGKGAPDQQDPKSKPKKKLYRARAHSNPLNDQSFDVPTTPDGIDWSEHFPCLASDGAGAGKEAEAAGGRVVEFLDVGCGFGGFLIKLADLYPEKLSLGLELRDKVSEYVKDRIDVLRENHEAEGLYRNVAIIRANAMRDLPHYFRKGQLTKVFFLFPDPHFKACNYRRRIISTPLLDEYAYFLAKGGILYTITDVEELGKWMRDHLDAHPLFRRISDEDLEGDKAAQFLPSASEEAQKVKRNEGKVRHSFVRPSGLSSLTAVTCDLCVAC